MVAAPNISNAGSCLDIALKKISIIEKKMPDGLVPIYEDEPVIRFGWSFPPSHDCFLVIWKATSGPNAGLKFAGLTTGVDHISLRIGHSYMAHPANGLGRVTIFHELPSGEKFTVICDGPEVAAAL